MDTYPNEGLRHRAAVMFFDFLYRHPVATQRVLGYICLALAGLLVWQTYKTLELLLVAALGIGR